MTRWIQSQRLLLINNIEKLCEVLFSFLLQMLMFDLRKSKLGYTNNLARVSESSFTSLFLNLQSQKKEEAFFPVSQRY